MTGVIRSAAGLVQPSAAAPADLVLDGLTVAPVAAYSLRRLRSAYAGNPLAAPTRDLLFAGADLDTADAVSLAAGGDLDVVSWYDQSAHSDGGTPVGGTRRLTQATAGKRFRLVVAGGTLNTTANGRPALKTTANVQGYASTAFGVAYTGTILAGALVVALGTQNLARGASATKDNGNDYDSTTKGRFVHRTGTTAVAQGGRQFTDLGSLAIVNGQLYAFTAIFNGTNFVLTREDGTSTSAGSSGAFDVNQVYLGMEDDSGGQAGPAGVFCEAIFWFGTGAGDLAALNADLAAVQANQKTYWID